MNAAAPSRKGAAGERRLPRPIEDLREAAKQAVRDYRSSLPKIFRAPTPFTLNSAFMRPATKANLEASVELRHFAAKGTPADRYLRPEIFGGPRGMKRSEKALAAGGGG